ncbi:MAG: hypothetical protein RIE06_27960 [Roseibium album]|uniref:XrtA system polysaccharide chain length determinant n=1 Tax=Roseibium album TaxID=311410 RepID=UPI0032EF416A
MAVASAADQNNELQKLIVLMFHYAHGVWSYRWVALCLVWICCLAGWIFVYLLPNTYSASATVYVDTESVLRPLLRGLAVESDVMSEVDIMTRAIVSRPNLEAVAREIDLDVRSTTTAGYERQLEQLAQRISIGRDGRGVFSISYEDASRNRALTVVTSLLDTFVEDTLGSKFEDSARAEKTLRAQIESYEARMTEAEDRLKDFKRDNVGMMPGERGDYYDQLQSAVADLEDVRGRLRIEENKRAALQRQIVGEEPVFGFMTPVIGNEGDGSPLDRQIADLEQRLANLSFEYTDRHPQVIRTQSLLKELRQRKQDRSSARSSDEGEPIASSALDLNPVYQNMKIQLSNVQVEIASLRTLLKDKEAEVARLRELVDVIPQVEAELTRLNRDYDVVNARYQEMLQRWENLQTSQSVGSSSESVKFRVIEPPFAASEAVGPPRGVFLTGVFLAAVAAGIGGAILLSLFRPVFFLPQELSFSGLPVLGTVARIYTPQARQRVNIGRLVFAALSGSVLIALGLATAFSSPASEFLRGIL